MKSTYSIANFTPQRLPNYFQYSWHSLEASSELGQERIRGAEQHGKEKLRMWPAPFPFAGDSCISAELLVSVWAV